MSGSAMRRGGNAGEVELNIVPLVDLCCLLILFFILTAQISSANLANIQPPAPHNSIALKTDPANEPKRVVVNVVSRTPPGADKANLSAERLADLIDDSRYPKEYTIGGKSFPCEPDVTPDIAKDKLVVAFNEQIRSALAAGIIKKADEFSVEIRGDHRVMAQFMNPILMAAAEAGMNQINITALEGGKKEGAHP